MSIVKIFEAATTVGELRKQLAMFSDDVPFGFRNQPMQVLYHDKYDNVDYVSFQEHVIEEHECICGLRGLRSWETDECPFSIEVHNDNNYCTRKKGNKVPDPI